MNKIISNKHLCLILSLVLSFGYMGGCKSQKKVAEEEAARIKAENTAQAKELLTTILNDDGQLTLSEKERMLRQAKALNSNDPEVKELIAQVEEMLAKEREAQNTTQEVRTKDPTVEDELSGLFAQIAGAANSNSANNLIESGLNMFSSPEAPVLIIINETGGIKDYDEPTTIERYLHYIKDRRLSPNAVYNVVKNDQGKISELELVKK